MAHSNFIHLCLWCVFFRCMEKIAWIQGTTHGCQSLSSGGSQTEELQLFLVLVLLLVYTTTVMGNLLIIVTVTSESRHNTPMYFLL